MAMWVYAFQCMCLMPEVLGSLELELQAVVNRLGARNQIQISKCSYPLQSYLLVSFYTFLKFYECKCTCDTVDMWKSEDKLWNWFSPSTFVWELEFLEMELGRHSWHGGFFVLSHLVGSSLLFLFLFHFLNYIYLFIYVYARAHMHCMVYIWVPEFDLRSSGLG